MKKINEDWHRFQAHHFSKLGHVLSGFFNELTLIEG
jgi:hypothetical protein